MEAKFNNAFILSGGGTRLMIYLGMYAALEKLEMKPNVLIATCGAALATTVINAFEDNESRKEYLKSEEYYKFYNKRRLTAESKLSRIGVFSMKKVLDKRNAPFIEDVFSRYLSEMDQDFSEELPFLENVKFSNESPTIIVGSKMLFDPKDIGNKREGKKLYKKVLFTDAETAKNIDVEKIKILTKNYKDSAVDENIKIDTHKSMLTTARISISDMFYVAPVYFEENYYAGGAIDLVPIELAKYLANSTVIEKKQPYNAIEEALVRAVLGYSGNKRLEEIERYAPEFQIDTINAKKELEGHYMKKTIDWKKLKIDFHFPRDYKQFREDQEKQWEYGYQQTLKSIQLKK